MPSKINHSASSSRAINDGFAKEKDEIDQVKEDYKKGDSALRTGTLDKNADKHVSKDFVEKIRKNNIVCKALVIHILIW